MKGRWFQFYVMVTLWTCTQGYEAFEILDENKDYPGKCVSKDHTNKRLILSVGESRPAEIGRCFKLECEKEEPQYILHKFGCKTIKPPKGCKLEANDTLRYPKCCPKLKCLGDENLP